jgi:hypothetical protein
MTSVKLSSMTFARVVSDELSERRGAAVPRRAWHRARALPAVGMPMERRRRRIATAISFALHLLLIWALIRSPDLGNQNPNLVEIEQGGGGPGPAGGGGGGTRGTGGVKYVQVAPSPPVAPPQVKPVLPPIVPPVEPPKPVLPPADPPPPPPPSPEPPRMRPRPL